jgi:hypothetical protein
MPYPVYISSETLRLKKLFVNWLQSENDEPSEGFCVSASSFPAAAAAAL